MPTATYKEKKNIEAKYISIELCIDYIYFYPGNALWDIYVPRFFPAFATLI